MVDGIPSDILDGILEWVDGSNVNYSDDNTPARPMTMEDVFHILSVYNTHQVTFTQRGI
jgi:hypothetical protein